jgi:hypothetical protein
MAPSHPLSCYASSWTMAGGESQWLMKVGAVTGLLLMLPCCPALVEIPEPLLHDTRVPSLASLHVVPLCLQV